MSEIDKGLKSLNFARTYKYIAAYRITFDPDYRKKTCDKDISPEKLEPFSEQGYLGARWELDFECHSKKINCDSVECIVNRSKYRTNQLAALKEIKLNKEIKSNELNQILMSMVTDRRICYSTAISFLSGMLRAKYYKKGYSRRIAKIIKIIETIQRPDLEKYSVASELTAKLGKYYFGAPYREKKGLFLISPPPDEYQKKVIDILYELITRAMDKEITSFRKAKKSYEKVKKRVCAKYVSIIKKHYGEFDERYNAGQFMLNNVRRFRRELLPHIIQLMKRAGGAGSDEYRYYVKGEYVDIFTTKAIHEMCR